MFTNVPSFNPNLPSSGTGNATSDVVAKVYEALLKAMNPPHNQGYITTGHVAIKSKSGNIDINFGEQAAQALSSQRRREVQLFLDKGITETVVSKTMYTQRGDVPLSTNLHAAARFVAADGRSAELPQEVRKWYTNALRGILKGHLNVAISILENSTHVGCVPLAVLKERAGFGTAVVGKLGFMDPTHQTVTDWEFGESGVTWH